MFIKVDDNGKIIATCSIKADDSFVETIVNNFDLSNFDYFVKDNSIVVEKKDKEDLEKLARIHYLQERLRQLSQDFVQAMAGAYFEDLEARKVEFQTLHNELRVLEGKEPRLYNSQNSEADPEVIE